MESQEKSNAMKNLLEAFKNADQKSTSEPSTSEYHFRKCAYCGRAEKDAPISVGRYDEPVCSSCASELIQQKLDYEILADKVTHHLKFLMTGAGNENLVWNKKIKIKLCMNLQLPSPFDRMYSAFEKWWKEKGGQVWADCLPLTSDDKETRRGKENCAAITTVRFKLPAEKKGLGGISASLFRILVCCVKFLLALPAVHRETFKLKCRTDVPRGIAVGGIVYAVVLDYLLINDLKGKSVPVQEKEALAAWCVVHYLHIMDYDQYSNYYHTLLKEDAHPLKAEYEKICQTADPFKKNKIKPIATLYTNLNR